MDDLAARRLRLERDGVDSGVRAQRTVAAPFGDVAIPVVDPDDIAAVAAAALRDERHAGAIYELTGPEGIGPREQTNALAEAIGVALSFVELTRAQAAEAWRAFMPSTVVETTLDAIGTPNEIERRISPDVEQVLGRPAQSFARVGQTQCQCLSLRDAAPLSTCGCWAGIELRPASVTVQDLMRNDDLRRLDQETILCGMNHAASRDRCGEALALSWWSSRCSVRRAARLTTQEWGARAAVPQGRSASTSTGTGTGTGRGEAEQEGAEMATLR